MEELPAAIEGLKQELLEDRARALSGIESFGIISVQTRGNAAEVGLEESQLTDYLRLKFKNNFAGVKFRDARKARPSVRTCQGWDVVRTRDLVRER